MPRLFPVLLNSLLISLLLGACATEPNDPTQIAGTACASREAPTGSNLPKRERCAPISDEERLRSREAAEAAREDFKRSQLGGPAGR